MIVGEKRDVISAFCKPINVKTWHLDYIGLADVSPLTRSRLCLPCVCHIYFAAVLFLNAVLVGHQTELNQTLQQ